jgi:hypothetical protein
MNEIIEHFTKLKHDIFVVKETYEKNNYEHAFIFYNMLYNLMDDYINEFEELSYDTSNYLREIYMYTNDEMGCLNFF